jgi:hypothetical protein
MAQLLTMTALPPPPTQAFHTFLITTRNRRVMKVIRQEVRDRAPSADGATKTARLAAMHLFSSGDEQRGCTDSCRGGGDKMASH